MKLTDAMAKGREEMEWTVNVLENNAKLSGDPRKGCALGLAAVGLGADNGMMASSMILNGQPVNFACPGATAELWNQIAMTNNECASYEEAVLALKEAGLDQVEVELSEEER